MVDIERIFKSLSLKYYTIYSIIIILTIVGYFLNYFNSINVDNSLFLREVLPIISIVMMISFLTVGIALFEIKKKAIRSIENVFNKQKEYIKLGKIRLYLIGLSIIWGVFAFYISLSVNVLIVIGVSAAALLYARPSLSKIESDIE